MTVTAHILSPWTAATINGTEANVPQLHVDYPSVSWNDVTGQPAQNLPTNPNYVMLACRLEQSVLDDILGDNDYDVVWTSGDMGNVPVARLNRIKGKLPGLQYRGEGWGVVNEDIRKHLKRLPKGNRPQRV